MFRCTQMLPKTGAQKVTRCSCLKVGSVEDEFYHCFFEKWNRRNTRINEVDHLSDIYNFCILCLVQLSQDWRNYPRLTAGLLQLNGSFEQGFDRVYREALDKTTNDTAILVQLNPAEKIIAVIKSKIRNASAKNRQIFLGLVKQIVDETIVETWAKWILSSRMEVYKTIKFFKV